MKHIHAYALISHDKGEEFGKQLDEALRSFQSQDMEVEVQYQPCLTTNQIMFSALVLGRKAGIPHD